MRSLIYIVTMATFLLTGFSMAADQLPYGTVDGAIGQTAVVKDESRKLERGVVAVTIPSFDDSVIIDAAFLVVTVSTQGDDSDPLFIVAAPATVAPETRTATWNSEWTSMSGGFDSENLAMVPMATTSEAAEIRIDVTNIVRRWFDGSAPNYGFILKSLSEDKSTFSWIRDGRYGGDDAKLQIFYSLNPLAAD